MDGQKVDLRHINKQKKINKQPSIRLPKFAAGNRRSVRRDSSGKFTNASVWRKWLDTLRAKRVLPFALLVAVVGSVLVIATFANSPAARYPYQYSMYDCPGFNNSADPSPDGSKSSPNYSCIDQSAESTAFRAYQGIMNADPTTSQYALATQKLAGDRLRVETLAKEILAISPKKGLAHNQFIESLYWDMHGKAITAASLSQYKSQLDNKQVSREQLAASFVTSASSQSHLRNKFLQYRKNKTKISIVQTARSRQLERLQQAQNLYSQIKPNFDLIKNRVSGVSDMNRRAEAYAKKADIDIVLSNVTDIEQYIVLSEAWLNEVKTKSWRTDIRKKYDEIAALALEARKVAEYSPDIPDRDVKKEADLALIARTYADGSAKDIEYRLNQMRLYQKASENKYLAEAERRGKWLASVYGKAQNNLPTGIRHWMDDTFPGKRIHILKIDLTNPKLKLRASTYAERGKKPSDFAKSIGAVAAINGNYFDTKKDYEPLGLAVGNTQVWPKGRDNNDHSFLACTAQNDCIIEKRLSTTAHNGKYTNVVSGGGGLSGTLVEPGFRWSIKPGSAGCKTDQEHTCRDPHPRTGVGLSGDRKTMWWIMVESRHSNVTGLSFYDFARVFEKLNVKWAINLDGGGSSGMYLNGKLVNDRPSNEPTERKVANSLAVIIK